PDHRAVDLLTHPDFTARFRPRVGSTSLALAWVAAGKRAAYVTDGGDLTASVHFAAGIALCRAAGCVVTGIDRAPLGPAGRRLVAAADQDTHARLLAMLRQPGCSPAAGGRSQWRSSGRPGGCDGGRRRERTHMTQARTTTAPATRNLLAGIVTDGAFKAVLGGAFLIAASQLGELLGTATWLT